MGEQARYLEVIRGRRKVLGGTLDELVALAKAGKLRPRDQIGGVTASGPVDLHSVPELARLVPTHREYLVSRSLRALVIFDIFIGSIMALALAVALSGARKGAPPLREFLFTVVLWGAFFGLPVVPLARERKKLMAMREAGDVSGVVPDPTPEDRDLRLYLARPGRATWFLAGSLVLPFVLSLLLPAHWLEEHFAKVNDRSSGEVWRLATAMFVHAGIGHLIFNFSALSEFGRMVENLYGWRRLLVVYFTSGIFGFVASFLTTPAPSVGASGGIFGLIGVLLAVGLRYRHRWPATARRRLTVEMALCIGVNVALGLLATFIDNAAHMGGLVAGIACGMLMHLQPDAAAHLRAIEPQAAQESVGRTTG